MLSKNIKFELEKLKSEERYHVLKTVPPKKINFSSNDYLCLTNDTHLVNQFYNYCGPDGLLLSASSSRLIDGSYDIIMELEKLAGEIYENSALVFNSGFDANFSIISTFYDEKSLIISDRLNHDSIYDSVINSKCKTITYNHLDISQLEVLLIKYSPRYNDILVITESICSINGEKIDLNKIIELKKQFNFHLMVNEAHSYSVFGYGITYNSGFLKYVDFLIIPLSKGGASIGAFVITSELYKDFLINKSKHLFYSTPLPPINNNWNLFVLQNMIKFQDKRDKLDDLTNYTYSTFKEYNISTSSNTHILSLTTGNAAKTEKICNNLLNRGFAVYHSKSLISDKERSKIKISLSSNLKKQDIKLFTKALKDELSSFF